MGSDILTICVVGCAEGDRVERLRGEGYDAYGIDVSPTAIGAARERVAPFVFVADAEKRSDWMWFSSRTGVDTFDLIITERCISQFEEPERTCDLLREYGDRVRHEVSTIASAEKPADEPLTPSEWQARVDPDEVDEWCDATVSAHGGELGVEQSAGCE